jgi:hypothetical protein
MLSYPSGISSLIMVCAYCVSFVRDQGTHPRKRM